MNTTEMEKDLPIIEKLLKFRNQALCIKLNIQVLKDVWILQSYFKEKSTGTFYKVVQENCIFRIVLETYKILCDSKKQSATVIEMANDIYREMEKIERFKDMQQELNNMKKQFSSNLNKYKNVKTIIELARNKVYAHNDQEYHWFSKNYIEKWGMTDRIYDDIMKIADICINYCNEILKMFNQTPIYEYPYHDDIKHLFGLETERDKGKKYLEKFL